MVSLNFKIDDSVLASYIITNYQADSYIPYAEERYKKSLVAFQNLAWEKSKDLTTLLDGRFPIFRYKTNKDISYSKLGGDLENFINELIMSKEFKLLKDQTVDSQKLVEQEWNNNFEKTYAYINSIGVKIDGTFEVLLVHPGLKAGNYIGNNRLMWSHQEYWANYNTVYLWHEILHSYFESNDKTHAIIELITDEELRKQLNATDYPPFVGHKYLTEIKTKGSPIWQAYLESGNRDMDHLINEFEKLS